MGLVGKMHRGNMQKYFTKFWNNQRNSKGLILLRYLTNITLIVAITSLLGLVKISYETIQEITHITEKKTALESEVFLLKDLLHQITNAETGSRGYLITGKYNHLQYYYDAIAQVERIKKKLKTEINNHHPEDTDKLIKLNRLIEERLALIKSEIVFKDEKVNNQRRLVSLTDEGKIVQDQIRLLINQLEDITWENFHNNIKVTASHTQMIILLLILGFLTSFLLFLVVYFLLKKQLKKRQQAEDKLPSLYNSVPYGYHSLDENGYIIEINNAELEWLGYSREEVVNQMKFDDLLTRESQEFFSSEFPQFQERGYLRNGEFNMICKNGEVIPVLVNATAIKDTEGKFIASHSTVFNITERQHMELDLRRSNRALKTITNINQIFIKIDQETTLLQEICQILVDDGGYIFAWVALPCLDAEKSIVSIAQAGKELGYLEVVDITWADTELGQGPIGRAIRSGKYVVVNDLGHDQLFSPWQDAARRRGYAACIALPLINENDQEVFSVLTIYSGTNTAFYPEEVNLLLELAKDISYGINSLRIRRAKQETEKVLVAKEEQLRLALASADMISWDWSLLTNQITWSQGYQLLFGTTISQFDSTYTNFSRSIYPEDLPEFHRKIQEARVNHGEYYHQFRVVWPNHSLHWLEGRGRYFYNEAGEAVRMLGVFYDISDRHQQEALLMASKNELEGKVRERTLELQQSQDRLAGILDIAEDAIISIDVAQRITLFNQGAEKIFGYTATEVLGHKLDILLPPRFANVHRQNVWKFAKSSVKSRPMGERNHVFARRKDGSEFPAEASIAHLELGPEKIMTVFLRDVTERLQAESRIKQLASIVESSTDAIVGKDLNGKIISWNHGAEIVYGYTATEMIGQSINKIIPNSYLDEFPTVMEKVKKGEITEHYEAIRQRKDGKIIWVALTISPMRNEAQQIIGASTIARDITMRKQIEGILRETERRWRSLLENVELVVVGLDVIGQVEYINPFFLKLTGYERQEIFGSNWFKTCVPTSQVEKVEKVFQTLLATDEPSHYNHSILTKSGEARIISWNHTVLRNTDGKAIGTMSIGEDVTERYLLEKMKDEFVSVVSHELRTPLTAIHGALSLLNGGYIDPLSERGNQAIKIAADSAERLVRLVNDILELERLQSGKIKLEKTSINIRDLLLHAQAEFEVTATKANITIETIATDMNISADRDRLLQVLTNLLSNAIKFSPPDTKIVLTAHPHQYRTKYSLMPEVDCPYVLFTVKDYGRGIPPGKIEKIFERFQQVDSSDSRQKGGTGLGLAICRNIVEQHGGRIWVKSILERGSKFYFTIPIELIEETTYSKKLS